MQASAQPHDFFTLAIGLVHRLRSGSLRLEGTPNEIRHELRKLPHNGYHPDEIPDIGPCPEGCGDKVRLDRLDLLAEHRASGRCRRLLALLAVLMIWGIADGASGPIRGLPYWMKIQPPAYAKRADPKPATEIGKQWKAIYTNIAAKTHISIINVKMCHWVPVPSLGQRLVFCVAVLQSTRDSSVSCWAVAISGQGQGLQAQRIVCHKEDLALGKRLSGPAA